MSKKDPLRALSKKFPAPKEVKSIFGDLKDEPDRVVAIVASALAESFLERTIIAHLATSDPNLIGELFKSRGPISEFHAKILIAEAFGLIPPNAAKEFHRIKRIRNVFAHAIISVSFETEEIAKEVDDFLMHKAMEQTKSTQVIKLTPLPRKSTFLLMAQICCIVMDSTQKKITGESLSD
jgi:hypothetical protein